MPRFSIIVPIFNAEKYIERCVFSITKQSFTDFELLLIDDGSEDNSLQICKELAKSDKRITVIHQENRGAASARNVGIIASKGDYILFVDADDTVELDYLFSINATAECYNQPDIIEFKLCHISPFGHTCILGTTLNAGIYDRSFIENEFLPIMLQIIESEKYYNIFNVLRAIKRNVFEKGVMFNEAIKRWEDRLFAMEAFDCANNIAVLQLPLYNYYGHSEGGLGGKYQPDTYKYVIEAYRSLDKRFSDRYDMKTEYSIHCKALLLENCINEILKNEPEYNENNTLLNLLKDPYIFNMCKTAKINVGIFSAKKHIVCRNYDKAITVLKRRRERFAKKAKIKSKIKTVYKRFFKD